MRRYWIALDHSDDKLFRRVDGQNVRFQLVQEVLDVGAGDWGVVVAPGHLSAIKGFPGSRGLAIGMPDIVDRRGLDSLALPDIDIGTVKLGFSHIERQGCDETAMAVLAHTDAVNEVVLEPYCLVVDCLARLSNAIAALPSGKVVLKLATDAASIQAIETARLEEGWLARSDGANWELFGRNLSIAHSAGCRGVMAGRAIWQDQIDKDEEHRRLSLKERMSWAHECLS